MKLLKTLLISSILLIHSLSAQEETNWDYFGEFKTYFTKIYKVKENPNLENFNELLSYNSIQLNLDYLDENFYFSMTPYAYIYFTESGDELLGSNYSDRFQDKDLFFRSLYMSYTFDKTTIGIGILPLSNSFPMHFTSDYYQDGEGLSIISDVDPLALFMTYRVNDENKILLGGGILDTQIIPTGQYVNKHNKDKSYGIFLTQTITEGKFKIINDFKLTNIYFDKIQSGKLYNIGVGLSWDDSEYSGWTLYNVSALSLYDNNSIASQEEVMASNSKYTTGIVKFPQSFVFDTKKYTGGANLLGFRKDVDFFNI